jgi:hypothetical protein
MLPGHTVVCVQYVWAQRQWQELEIVLGGHAQGPDSACHVDAGVSR